MAGGRRWVPERSVDSWFAAELALNQPISLLWSPTNYAGSVDHVVWSPGSRLAVIEAKGIELANARDPSSSWRVPLEMQQLWDHSRQAWPVMYLMLTRPLTLGSALPGPLALPWIPFCWQGSCPGLCRYCQPPASSVLRARRDPFGPPGAAAWPLTERVLVQRWFAHWAWLVSARALAAEVFRRYRVTSRPSRKRNGWIPAGVGGQPIGGLPLCHWLASSRDVTASTPGLVDPGRPDGWEASGVLPDDQGLQFPGRGDEPLRALLNSVFEAGGGGLAGDSPLRLIEL
jgi:hypothetical protein